MAELVTRRQFAQYVVGGSIAAALPRQAKADPATAMAVMQGAQLVLSWMTPTVNSTATLLTGLNAIIDQLNAINQGIQAAIAAIHQLRFHVTETANRAAHDAMHARVMGVYIALKAEQFKYSRRREAGDPRSARRNYRIELDKLYDDIRFARRQAIFIRPDEYRSSALTLCMAFSCESEIAAGLEKDLIEYESLANDYGGWMKSALDVTATGSIASSLANTSEALADLQTKMDGEAFGRRITRLPAGRHEAECTHLKWPDTGTDLYTTAFATIEQSEIIEDIEVWRGNIVTGIDYVDGGRRLDGATSGHVPTMSPCTSEIQIPCSICTRPEWRGPQNRLAARAAAWQSAMTTRNELRWKILALRRVVQACEQVRNSTNAIISVIRQPSRVPI